MQQLFSPKDIAERYKCSEQCARNYMHRMEHMEKPLRVTAQAVAAWEIGRTYQPQKATSEKPKRVTRQQPAPGEKFIIPRTRPQKKSADVAATADRDGRP